MTTPETTPPAGTATSPVEAIDRALVVLEALARGGAQGVQLADLATELGLNKTTVHRTLAALKFRDFASQDPVSGAYLLGAAAVALGEVMLRLDPGARPHPHHPPVRRLGGRRRVQRHRWPARAFGLRTAVVTALADNEVGRLVEDLILQGGVDTQLIQWRDYDGIGRTVRNGLNFTERGFGVRGAVGVCDRGLTAASQLGPDDVDWDHLFGELGVRWLHTGGIYAALSETSAQTAVEYGAAHGALAMTTPGDTTMVTKAEVLKLAAGGSARVDR